MELQTTFVRRVGGAGTTPVLGSDTLPTGLPAVGSAADNLGNIVRANHSFIEGQPIQRLAVVYVYAGGGAAPSVPVTAYAYAKDTDTWYVLGSATLTNGVLSYVDVLGGVLPKKTPAMDGTTDMLDSVEVVLLASSPVGAPDGTYTFGAVFDCSADGGQSSALLSAIVTLLGPPLLVSDSTALTNSHSTVLETWRLHKSGSTKVRSSKAASALGVNGWLLIFNSLTLPNDGALTVREPVQVLDGDVNGDQWQGTTGPLAIGMIAVVSTTHPQLTAPLTQPVITGDGGVLSWAIGQGFRALWSGNVDATTGPGAGNARSYLYGEISIPGGNATLTVFKDAAHLLQVAHGALVGNGGGVITLVADGSSQVTGTITIAAGVGAHAAVQFEVLTGVFFDAEVL